MIKRIQKTLLILLVCIAPISSFGQSFEQGTTVVSVGYGIPNLSLLGIGIDYSGTNETFTGIGPAHAKIEYGVTKVFGLGLSINYVSGEYSYDNLPYQYKYVRQNVKFNLRANFHYVRSEHLDVYSGFGFGYGISYGKWTSNEPGFSRSDHNNKLPIGFEITTGLRYLITPNIGLYTELGVAKSILQIGVCFKFDGEKNNSAK